MTNEEFDAQFKVSDNIRHRDWDTFDTPKISAIGISNILLVYPSGREVVFPKDNNWVNTGEPAYRPFTYKADTRIIGMAVREKSCDRILLITSIFNFTGNDFVTIAGSSCNMRDLLNKYTFLDGSPCGNLME